MLIASAARVLALGCAAMLLVATTHKARALRERSASEFPLMHLSRRRMRRAAVLLALAAAVELLVVAALLVHPTAGLVALSVLLIVYTRELRRLPPAAPCNCFGSTRVDAAATAIRRNHVLVGVAAAVAAASLASGGTVAPITQATAGAAAILAATGAATQLAGRGAIASRRTGRTEP